MTAPFRGKKKEILPSPMTKPPIPTENSKTKGQHTQTPPKTAITQRLRTDSIVAEAPSRESVPAAVSRPEEDESEMPSDLEEFILLDEADSDVSNDKTAQDDVPKVYDSHFHLDRFSKAIWNREVGHTVEDLIEYSILTRCPTHRASMSR